MSGSFRPLLAVSMGDPAGVGPEVVVKAASVADVYEESRLLVLGDVDILARAAMEMAPTVRIESFKTAESAYKDASSFEQGDGRLAVVSVSDIDDPAFDWGRAVAASDRAQVEYIRAAFDAVESGFVQAMVTAPVNKASIHRAGVDFPGHTEMLASMSKSSSLGRMQPNLSFEPVMMLAGPTLKVVPLTTHIPLREVPSRLTEALVVHGIRTTHDAFVRYFGQIKPRIALAGLNPHAGDGGLFGDEEAKVIEPAVALVRREGIDAVGPLPGDSVFHRAAAGEFDVVLGMYHDQALVPLKLLDFDHAVNVTLGLPLIRTSVDHGTAYDIAGRGVASASSMIAAIRLAARMVRVAGPASEAGTG